MKLHSIDSLIKLHQKQAAILDLMKGSRGLVLDQLAEMYAENSARIIHILSRDSSEKIQLLKNPSLS